MLTPMKLTPLLPPEQLGNYVRSLWTLQSASDEEHRFDAVADGCAGIIFQRPGAGSLQLADGKVLPTVFLYGQSTETRELHCSGQFDVLGIFLRPAAVRSMFGIDATELTDGCVDLADLIKGKDQRLVERLVNAVSVEEQTAVLCTSLAENISANNAQADAIIHNAADRIRAANGRLSISALRAELGITERTFERRFKASIGMPAKLFARICRFQGALDPLLGGDYARLSDIAFDHDYADQSHYVREFKAFAGHTPKHYPSRRVALVEGLHQLR
jgi:AraC-like DNA-binding protein